MRKDVKLDPSSTIDLSRVTAVIFNSTESNEKISLGNIYFRHIFGIRGKHVSLDGKIVMPDRAPWKSRSQSTVMFKIDKNLTIGSTTNIKAGRILMQANGTIVSQPGFTMDSYVNNTCNTHHRTELFSCVPHKTLSDDFNQETYLKSFNS